MSFFQQRRAEVALQHALAARKRDAPAGLAIKTAILFDLGENLVHGHFLAEQVECIRRTNGDAFAAVGAQIPIDPDFAIGRHY